MCKLKDLLFTVDLKSGYHHVDVDPSFWQFLGFEWQGRYYVFCRLSFDLATACFVFTKILKQLVQHWRSMGIRLIPYIDEFLFFTSSVQEFASVQAQVLADFSKAGFVLSLEKCQLQASHVVKFLEFVQLIPSMESFACPQCAEEEAHQFHLLLPSYPLQSVSQTASKDHWSNYFDEPSHRTSLWTFLKVPSPSTEHKGFLA